MSESSPSREEEPLVDNEAVEDQTVIPSPVGSERLTGINRAVDVGLFLSYSLAGLVTGLLLTIKQLKIPPEQLLSLQMDAMTPEQQTILSAGVSVGILAGVILWRLYRKL